MDNWTNNLSSTFPPPSTPYLNHNLPPEFSPAMPSTSHVIDMPLRFDPSSFSSGNFQIPTGCWTDNRVFAPPPMTMPEIPQNQAMRIRDNYLMDYSGTKSGVVLGPNPEYNYVDLMPPPSSIGGYEANRFPSSSSFFNSTAQWIGTEHNNFFAPARLERSEDELLNELADSFLDINTAAYDNVGGHDDDHYKTTQFCSPSTQSTAQNFSAPAPETSFDVADPNCLGNPMVAEARIFEYSGDSVKRRRVAAVPVSSPPPPRDRAVDASNGEDKSKKSENTWTLHEHNLFLVGMEIYGKSDWKNIANKVVITKSATQVASHAQKYFLRQQEPEKRKRSSIHDNTTVDPQLLSQVLARMNYSPFPPPPRPCQPPIVLQPVPLRQVSFHQLQQFAPADHHQDEGYVHHEPQPNVFES